MKTHIIALKLEISRVIAVSKSVLKLKNSFNFGPTAVLPLNRRFRKCKYFFINQYLILTDNKYICLKTEVYIKAQ